MAILKCVLFILFGIILQALKNKVSDIYERKTGFAVLSVSNSRKMFLVFVLVILGLLSLFFNPEDKLGFIGLILIAFLSILVLTYKAYKQTNLKFAIIAFIIYFLFLLSLLLAIFVAMFSIYLDIINR